MNIKVLRAMRAKKLYENFNPYHDRRGRFTTKSGAETISHNPKFTGPQAPTGPAKPVEASKSDAKPAPTYSNLPTGVTISIPDKKFSRRQKQAEEQMLDMINRFPGFAKMVTSSQVKPKVQVSPEVRTPGGKLVAGQYWNNTGKIQVSSGLTGGVDTYALGPNKFVVSCSFQSALRHEVGHYFMEYSNNPRAIAKLKDAYYSGAAKKFLNTHRTA